MDKETTLEELKVKVKSFCSDRDWDQFHGGKDLAIGIVTEASELLDLFRFKSDDQIREMFQSPGKFVEIRYELADVLFFILRFAQKFEIDLTVALQEKMERNAQRYPVEKAKGQNAKYDEL